MKVTLYGIRNCDTMKKAFAWLDEHGIDYAFHDYKKAGVPVQRLRAWSMRVGWEKLINTRGPTYRKIPEAEREGLGNAPDEARVLRLLEKYSSAIKRPVVEADGELLVGFDPDAYRRVLAP